MPHARHPRLLPTCLNGLAFLWAAAATTSLLLSAGHEGASTASALMGGEPVVGHMNVPLLSANGVWIVGLLGIVTLSAALPLGIILRSPNRHKSVTLVVGTLLVGFSLLGGVTVGAPYLPVAILLLISAAAPELAYRG